MAARRPRTMPSSTTAAASPAPAASHDSPGSPTDTTFADLGVPAKLTSALATAGITTPFPIQAATLPDSLDGHDVLGRGRTGSGKTYAFLLPVLARLAAGRDTRPPGRPRALILAPTRELASQIDAALAPLARALSLRTLTIFGGVGYGPQVSRLRSGVDIVVACPGRLTDHIENDHLRLDDVEITVLDEADHMADLGFLPAVRRLLDKTPETGQRLLFSATLDAEVDVLVQRYLTNPATHSMDSTQPPIEATHHVLHVQRDSRLPVLVDLAAAPGRTLVFTRTKRGARRLARHLVASGVPAVELHGDLSQNARTKNLRAFADGSANALVATDIAARGIHIDDIAQVIHADPPAEHKAYLHRSGRTARAGANGTVITLMTDEQVADVRALTRRAGISPRTSRMRPGDALLAELVPGERSFVTPAAQPAPDSPTSRSSGRGTAKRSARGGAGRRRNTSHSSSARPAGAAGFSAGSGRAHRRR